MKFLTETEKELYNKFKQSSLYKDYVFDKEELSKFKVDISFVKATGVKIDPKISVEYVINAMAMHPEIKPLIFILKRFLQLHKLNFPFNGMNTLLINYSL